MTQETDMPAETHSIMYLKVPLKHEAGSKGSMGGREYAFVCASMCVRVSACGVCMCECMYI